MRPVYKFQYVLMAYDTKLQVIETVAITIESDDVTKAFSEAQRRTQTFFGKQHYEGRRCYFIGQEEITGDGTPKPAPEFYMVYLHGGGSPRMMHKTEAEARAEAERLCKKMSRKTHLMCAIATCNPVVDVKWNDESEARNE